MMDRPDRSTSPLTANSPGGTLRMKDQLSRGPANQMPPLSQGSLPSIGAGMQGPGGSKFFQKGPIKPSPIPMQQMLPQEMHRPMPQRQYSPAPQHDLHGGYYDEEYGDEMEDDYGDEDQAPRAGGRQLSPEQENAILQDLLRSSQANKEFMKVLNILQNDPELRPLIFEHESLLRALKDMRELKAEQMLTILTAAETEMYESSKKQEEQQALQSRPPSRDASCEVQIINADEHKTMQTTIRELQNQSAELQKQVEDGYKKKCENCQRLRQQLKTMEESSRQEVEQLTAQLEQMAKTNEAELTELRKQLKLAPKVNNDKEKKLEREMAQMEKTYTEKIESLTRQLKEAGSQKEAPVQDTAEVKKLEARNAELKSDLERRLNDLEVSKSEAIFHKQEAKHLKEDNLKLDQELSQLRDKTQSLTVDLKNALAKPQAPEQPHVKQLSLLLRQLQQLVHRVRQQANIATSQPVKPTTEVTLDDVTEYVQFEVANTVTQALALAQSQKQQQQPQQVTVVSASDDNFMLKSQLLDEKERRLVVQEALSQSKADNLRYIAEVERLRQELRQTVVQVAVPQHTSEDFLRLQCQLNDCQDDNVSLKLRVADLEGQLSDELTSRQIAYSQQMESVKAALHQQFLDQKVKHEMALHAEKEAHHALKMTCAQLEERLYVSRETIQQLQAKVQEISKEAFEITNDNASLNRQLDYESVKNDVIRQKQNQLQTQIDVRKTTFTGDKSQFEKVISKYEAEIEQLKNSTGQMDRLQKANYENQIAQLQAENRKLIRQSTEVQEQHQGVGTGLRLNLEVALDKNRKLKGLLVRCLQRLNSTIQTQRAFYMLKAKLSENMFEDNEALNEQLAQLQSQTQSLTKQLGKALRSSNFQKPIKLNLSGLFQRETDQLDYVLSGLKGNCSVCELNLANNQLDDEDLKKICEVLQNDNKVTKLILAGNQFTTAKPLIQLMRTNGATLQYLDISQLQNLSDSDIREMTTNVLNLTAVEDLAICQIFQGDNYSQDSLVQSFASSVVALKQLKSLDISKNKFRPEILSHWLQKLSNLSSLQALAMSQVGLCDGVMPSFSSLMRSMTQLRILNLSNNPGLSSDSIKRVLQILRQHQITKLEELNLSKLQFSGNEEAFKELSMFLTSSKSLKTLSLMRVGLDDAMAFYLIEALARAPKLTTLKLDFNRVTGVFVDRYTSKLQQCGYTPSASLGMQLENSMSVLASDSEAESTARLGSARNETSPMSQIQQFGQKTAGLVHLSFEGNTGLGSKGAEAIAWLIKQKNDATKGLKMVNLNECGIDERGFDFLKDALVARGREAPELRIKVERNNFG